MPRPFPFPINIGTDICSVQRIFDILKVQKSSGIDAFLRRILTDQEREQFQQRSYSKTLRLWDRLQKKKFQLDRRRADLGIPKAWREQLALMSRDTEQNDNVNGKSNTSKPSERAATNTAVNERLPSKHYTRKVNNVDILCQLEDEIEDEESTMLTQLQKVAQFLAGRFAAKEAAMKAHRQRRLTWHDIWIRGREAQYGMSQAPEALIISEDGSWEDAQIVPLSISHDDGYATAVCMAFEGDADSVSHMSKPAVTHAKGGKEHR